MLIGDETLNSTAFIIERRHYNLYELNVSLIIIRGTLALLISLRDFWERFGILMFLGDCRKFRVPSTFSVKLKEIGVSSLRSF